MSWHCSRALAEGFWGGISSDGDASVPLSTTPMPVAFYWPDKTTEHSRLSRFGMTSQPLTADRGEELLTWFLAGFHAKTSVLRVEVKGSTESEAGSGQRWHGSLAKYDRVSHSLKTAQCSLLEDSTESCVTLPRWGSMRNGVVSEQMPLVHRIAETESGLWPTPNTQGYRSDGELKLLARSTIDRNEYLMMSDRAANSKRERHWPTPQASDNRDRGNLSTPAIARRVAKGKQVMLSMCVSEKNGRLNPDWVEWLMGWPIGQTDLRPLEMVKFHEWQQQHSLSSLDEPESSVSEAA
jgi:hypothetical protein